LSYCYFSKILEKLQEEMKTTQKKKVVDDHYSKNRGEYADVISEIKAKGRCPFCPSNFKYHKEPIIRKNGGWILSKNSWPYPNTKHHFIIIGEKHKERFQELTQRDFEAVRRLANFAIKKFRLAGGALTLRFGESRLTGATVCHIHFHLIEPELNKRTKRAKLVSFQIG
jgi:diadenosine tetraphosphate (Ap4A) HIT family hydrolase